MKTIVRLEVSDAQRNALACLIAEKSVKRLATREEVTSYVQGAIDSLSPERTFPESGEPAPGRYHARIEFEKRLVAGDVHESDWPSYQRGWNSVP